MGNLNNFFMLVICMSIVIFIVITPTLINFILVSELIWVGIYNVLVCAGIETNALLYLIYGLLVLCLATAESVVGLSLVMFKYILYGAVQWNAGCSRVAAVGYSSFMK